MKRFYWLGMKNFNQQKDEKMEIKNIQDIQAYLKKIELSKNDDETAHSMENSLHEYFIQFVASNANKELSDMAKEVLKSSDIDFDRWYA
ncbi:hypothetical protein UFOVP1309_14 [uncultured Caudovirales phage]|uniref:Uncharacterized protein n=1 Tax=uncultured Caudovirales phage TaxID=2100421 RepID=A0A6J5RTE2_9CAUD|nr:hypothetical protein UFOVP1309_14 [uncultured Caudovirales phage]